MYRQGLGDCFLVTLPRATGEPFFILIDCGVILGTADAVAKMEAVVADVAQTTQGHVDLLLATHEHWDHLSGFVQAADLFKGITFDHVWLGWTEDPDDPLARELGAEHQKLRLALAAAAARLRFGGGADGVVDGLLELFGAAGQGTTRDALERVKSFAKPRFCRPTDDPVEFPALPARLYVLGPPHDRAMIQRFNPSKAHPETFGLAGLFLDQSAPGFTDPDRDAPFDPLVQIPLEVAPSMPFFQQRYWGEPRPATGRAADEDQHAESDQGWRRIDGNWLDASSAFALHLDGATNNTSLALAIELADGRVLLFAADAMVGNWLSWQDLAWQVGDRTVTGGDLLRRTVLYKTGHHGSHNATLRDKGLEMMASLEVALIPVDHEMAVKKGWRRMPLESLEERLNELTRGRVLRIDKPVPPALAAAVAADAAGTLYYEVAL
jgi:hypothetical protein